MRLLCKPHLSRNPAWPRKPTAHPPREAPQTQDGPGFFAQLLPFVHRASNDSLQYPGDCQPFFCSFFPRDFPVPRRALREAFTTAPSRTQNGDHTSPKIKVKRKNSSFSDSETLA
jgi:hypothetical protein